MKRWQFVLATAATAALWILGFALAARLSAQVQPAAGARTAGAAFKNVTTSSLKDLSVDDFVTSMGLISADLGLDCADCHPGAGTDQADFVTDTPRKRTARRMVEMVGAINRANFGGAQRVTCWTCHHGRLTPATTLSLDNWYDAPNTELDDIVRQDNGAPTAEQVLDKFIAASGGAERLAGLTSFVATGTAVAYGELGGTAEFNIFAKSPNLRTALITYKDHPERGTSSWSFDGRIGWVKTPRGLLGEYELAGSELDGVRLEAQLAFPGLIRKALDNWRGAATRSIGDRDLLAVQGSGPRGFLATLYFDPATGLLARLVRYGPSPIGRMPTQIDYGDYRDVGGLKLPFEYKFTWMDGRYTAKVNEIKTNVAIEGARFGKPQGR